MIIKDITNIIITIIFIASFIGIFFFTYVSLIEKQIVLRQLNYITKDLTSTFSAISNPQLKISLQNILHNLKQPDMTDIDNKVSRSNNELKIKAFKILGYLLFFGLLLAYFFSVQFKFDLSDLIIKNLLTLILIAFIYFIFITYLAKEYISADPNYVKTIIITTLEEYSK